MNTGAITNYIDVAQIVLYAFWLFFFGLVIYLRREDKREGYPLESDRSERAPRVVIQGFPAMPEPKTFSLAHGSATSGRVDSRPIAAQPLLGFPGAPLEPTGNPMLDGIGPGAYANRADRPDHTHEGLDKIVPLRAAPGFFVPFATMDPVGMTVLGADNEVAGTVSDVWIDRSEPQVRYFEVQVAGSGRRVLLPAGFSRVDCTYRRIRVRAILAHQFKDVPGTARPDQVTLREEDRISAYYGAGTLYAEPSRLGPLL